MNYSRAMLPLFFASICLFGAAIATANATPTSKTAVKSEAASYNTAGFFPESELKPGQQGYALTVFKGAKIDRFSVEVLGVLHGMNSGGDFVVIKVTSGPSLTENLNIAEGMSGSPVYVDHKLVGAIAASIPFGSAPIGLVTPIADMLDAWDPNLPSRPNISLSSSATTPGNDGQIDMSELMSMISHNSASVSNDQLPSVRSLQIPVMVSGMSQQGINQLSSILSPYGMTPIAGGGMGTSKTGIETKGADQLVPGAALGCSLVQGDFDYTAIGTVTYRDKNRLIAFGHPFLGLGAIDAPLTTVNIVTMYPSYQTSTKLGEPLYNVGRVYQDRPYSIGGELGVAPHMVPMTVNVVDNTNKRHKRYHFEIINHPLLTAQFVVLVAQQAILETHGSPGDAVAKVTTTVDADQVGRVTRSNVFYDSLTIEQSATDDLDSLTRLLTSNSFYPLSIKGVDMQVTIDSSHATAQIDHIFLPKTKYKPGDTVNVGVLIKPYKEEPILKTVSLKIPSSTPNGALTLVVRGGGVSDGQTITLGGTTLILHSGSSSQGPTPANVNQLIRQYLDQPKNNDLVSTLQLPTTAVTVEGENLSLLPPIMSSVMRSSRSTGVHTARDQVKTTIPTQYVLTGSQSITLTVARENNLDTTPGLTSSTTSSDPSSADSSSSSSDSSGLPDESSTPSSTNDNSGALGIVQDSANSGQTITPMTSAPAVEPPLLPVTISGYKVTTVGLAPSTPDSVPPVAADATPNKVKTVGRLAQIWRQDTAQDFTAGNLDNTTITSADDLRLSLSLKPFAQSTSSYIWSLTQDRAHSVYAGTGDDGIVYQVTQGGTIKPFFKTGELEVTSLAYDASSGTIYAGTSPHGVVFAISPSGVGHRLGSVGDKYVTSLAIDPSRSRLYAATGGGTGDIYVISTSENGIPKQFFTSPETHLLSLAIDSSGTLYAGGSPDGVIYSISPDGVGKVVYDSAQPNITALAVDSQGTLYAGTSPAGLIYKISLTSADNFGREVKVLSARPTAAVSGLSIDGDGNVWASAGNSVYCVNPDGTTFTYTTPTDVILLSLLTGSDGHVYVGTGNTASIYRLGDNRTDQTVAYQGTYTSPVHDAKRPSRWGMIAWKSITPPGTSLILQTRTGDVPTPDSTWSDWSNDYNNQAGQKILSPPARFIQYKALLSSNNPQVRTDAMPRLNAVTIYYLTRSEPPIVTITSPSEGDFLHGSSTLRWTAVDPDHDTLSYDVFYSTDGKTYLPMPASTTISSPATADVTAKLKLELDKHPEIPLPVRQQMLAQAGETGPTDNQPADVQTNHVTTNSFTWDTKTVSDGQYQIKVIASNYQSDPSDLRTGDGVSRPFVVVNTAPVLALDASSTVVNANKSITLKGTATSTLAFVNAVQYQIDKSKDLYSASATDGIFDSNSSSFTVTTLPQSSGPHLVTITAIDEAGNSSSTSTTVVVP